MFSDFLTPPHPTLPVDEPALGAVEMEQLRREFPGAGLCEVIQMFTEEGESLLKQIAAATDRLDDRALRRATHALRGACANFGAQPLEALCLALEIAARRGQVEQAPGLLDQVRAEYHRVERALQQECLPLP